MPDLNDLSIVVCSKNDFTGLIRTLNSLDQKVLNGSTKVIVLSDYSSSQIKELKKKFNHHSFKIYQVDPQGIFSAQNYGLRKVESDFVQFLNGGDELMEPSALSELVFNLARADWGYGNLSIVSPDSYSRVYSFRYKKLLHRLGLRYVPHPSTIMRTKVAIELGGYDEKYVSAADHKLLIKFAQRGKPITVRKTVSKFYLGGLSTRNKKLIVADCSEISREIYGYFLRSRTIDTMIWKLVLGIRALKN